MGEKIWVKNESTGQERQMTRTSFKYNEAKRGSGNPLRPKFTYLRDVEEPKSQIQILMDQKKAEKAEAEKNAPRETEPESLKVPAKRGPKPKQAAE